MTTSESFRALRGQPAHQAGFAQSVEAAAEAVRAQIARRRCAAAAARATPARGAWPRPARSLAVPSRALPDDRIARGGPGSKTQRPRSRRRRP